MNKVHWLMTRIRISGEARRQRLLDAASEIIIEHGVKAVTMESVTAKNGVDRAIAYRYFKGREDLLSALFDREHASYIANENADVMEDSSLEDWMRGVLKHWFALVDAKGPLLNRLMNDQGPLAAKGWHQRRLDRSWWATKIMRSYRLQERTALHLAAIMVGGLTGVLDARNGTDDDAIIEHMVAGILAAAKALELSDAGGSGNNRD